MPLRSGPGPMAGSPPIRSGPWRTPTARRARHWRSTWPTRPSTASVTTPGTGELWIAYDLGLTPEKPLARIRFCRFDFAPEWGFRSALTAYYRLFPEAFRRRVDKQGLWMPFARISVLKNWEDFGFQFKEGNDETAWDDAHGIFTFRYTEPMTWWMPMSSGLSRTLDSATARSSPPGQTGPARGESPLHQRLPQRQRHTHGSLPRRAMEPRSRLEHELDAGHRG